MPKKKLRAQAPVGYIWCKEQWRPVGMCDACSKYRQKRCVSFKAFKEALNDGQDVEKGKDNKGKRRKGKR